MFLYLATNTTNGKQYVGKTTGTVEERWQKHVWNATSGTTDFYLSRAIRKYGVESFTIGPIAHFDTEHMLAKAEIAFIKELGTFVPNGYNMTKGGEGSSGYVHTEKSLTKMSKAKLGGGNGSSKLSEDQVKQIRSLYDAGGVTHRALARTFGVNHHNIACIVRRTTWAHVQQESPLLSAVMS